MSTSDYSPKPTRATLDEERLASLEVRAGQLQAHVEYLLERRRWWRRLALRRLENYRRERSWADSALRRAQVADRRVAKLEQLLAARPPLQLVGAPGAGQGGAA